MKKTLKLMTVLLMLLPTWLFAQCVEVSDYTTFPNIEPQTVDIQQAIDTAGSFGCLNFTTDLMFNGTLNVPKNQTWNGNVEWASTLNPVDDDVLPRLMYVGTAASAIKASNIHLKGVILQGNASTLMPLSLAIGLDIDGGNLRLDHSTVRGFTTLIKVRNSWYNVIESSNLMHAETIYDGGSVNNLNILNTKISKFDIGITSTGGVGPINIVGGAIEQWTNRIHDAKSGSVVAVNITGVYFENYPNTTIAEGLTSSTGTYFATFAFLMRGNFTMTGSVFIMHGVKRFMYNIGSLITMTGNRFILNHDYTTKPEYIVFTVEKSPMFTQKDSFEFISGGATVPYDPVIHTVKQFNNLVNLPNHDYLDLAEAWIRSQ